MTGFWEIIRPDKGDTWFGQFTDPIVSAFIALAVCSNAVYFYYCAALVELHEPTRLKLQGNGRPEWYLRVFNQILILGIWPALHSTFPIFATYMLVLYMTFMVWGYLTKGHLPAKSVFVRYFDMAGLAVSILLIADVGIFLRKTDTTTPPSQWVILGILCASYFVIAVWGCSRGVKAGFNPFSREYFERRALH
jgi:hypothetical protein